MWEEHRETTRGRDLDISGLSYDMLEQLGPQQWPLRPGEHQGQARLYTDGQFATPDGRARFADVPFSPLAEPRSAAWPFSLITGRLRDQWHGLSRTGNLGRLFGHDGEPVVEVHPQDLARLKLAEGSLVRVSSRRGSLVLPARASSSLQPTQLFIAMHWGQEVLGGQDAQGQPATGVNGLSSPAFCPQSKQPELKHAAVKLEKLDLPWRLTAMAWLPADQALALREQMKPLLGQFSAASLLPFGQEALQPGPPAARVGLILRAAHDAPLDEAVLAPLRAAFRLDGPAVLGYHGRPPWPAAGPCASSARRMAANASPASGWPVTPAATPGCAPCWKPTRPCPGRAASCWRPARWRARPQRPRSRQVCSCLNVSEEAIRAELPRCRGAAPERLGQLQAALKMRHSMRLLSAGAAPAGAGRAVGRGGRGRRRQRPQPGRLTIRRPGFCGSTP